MSKRFSAIAFLLMITLLLCSCSFPVKKPESGIYYCQELGISIDFSLCLDNGDKGTTLHNADGSCKAIGCYFDYGNGVFFMDLETQEEFFIGKFSWKRKADVFQIEQRENGKLTGKVYKFYPAESMDGICQHCTSA